MQRYGFLLILATMTWLPPAKAIPLAGDLPPGLITGGLPSGMMQEQDAARSWYEKGMTALANTQLTTAQDAFEKSAKLAPNLPHPLLGMADVALRRQDTASARKWLQKAEALSPDNPQVKHAMARFHYAQRDFDKARDALQTVLDKQPDNLLAHLDIGNIYANALHQPEQAIKAYRAAIRINPKHAGAHHSLGMTLWQTGQSDEAVAAFSQASELAPQNPLPLQALGQLYSDQGKPAEALKALAAAVAVQPNFVPAHLRTGDIYLGQGEFASALSSYDKAASVAPNNAEAHLKIGMALQGLGELDRAEAAYLSAIKLNSKLALAYNNLAWMSAVRRINLDQALQWAQTAAQLAPQAPAFQDTLGWVNYLRGNTTEAIAILTKAKELPRPTPDIDYHLGLIYLEQKKVNKAEQAFRAALAIAPDYAPAIKAIQQMQSH